MPRGGRRLGAGAPRGNFNGYKTGNHSKRMLAVFAALVNHPDKKALALDLYEHGFFPPPRKGQQRRPRRRHLPLEEVV